MAAELAIFKRHTLKVVTEMTFFFLPVYLFVFIILNEVHSQHCFLDGSIGKTDFFL